MSLTYSTFSELFEKTYAKELAEVIRAMDSNNLRASILFESIPPFDCSFPVVFGDVQKLVTFNTVEEKPKKKYNLPDWF